MPLCILCNSNLKENIEFIRNDGYGEIEKSTNYFYCNNESCNRYLLLTINTSYNGACERCGVLRSDMTKRWKYRKCVLDGLVYGRHKYT